MSDNRYPTVGQLQRTLSQRIQAVYRSCLEHQPTRITCQLSDTTLLIVLEDSLTQTETLLQENGHEELVADVRDKLDSSLKPLLQQEIEQILGVDVIDMLSDATLETGRSALVVILKEAPQVRHQKDMSPTISQG